MDKPPPDRVWRRCVRRLFTAAIWGYALAVLAVWGLIHYGGDRWWFATMMLFGPRWVYLLPLAVLAPATWRRPRLRWLLVAAALIVLVPIMGLCVPWQRFAGAGDGPSLRVLTCNLKGKCRNNAVFHELLRESLPDIVALQGCWRDAAIAWPEGWHFEQDGEMILASPYPLRQVRSLSITDPMFQDRVRLLRGIVETPHGDVTVVSLHMPSPHIGLRQVLDDSTLIRPSQSGTLVAQSELRRQAAEATVQYVDRIAEPVVIVGDLNVPPESPIYRQTWARYANAFSQAGLGYGYTEWPTVRWFRHGIRIDHILTRARLRPLASWLGPDVGSDHLPLLADLQFRETANTSPKR